jgi:tetratricopeptide (TPR) repeat protein
MSSSSGNNGRANFPLRLRSLGAGLALLLVSASALADAPHRFVFTAYSDAAGGIDVVVGRYQAALAQLRSYPGMTDPSSIETNRCVAYSMTRQRQEALAACDAAIRAADERQARALAYANRAVLYWLSNDYAAAGRDLAKARELSPRADFVARNVAALKAHAIMAPAAATAPGS